MNLTIVPYEEVETSVISDLIRDLRFLKLSIQVLAVTSVDCYAADLNFVFALAENSGRAAFI